MKGRLAVISILPWIQVFKRIDEVFYSQILLEDVLASSSFSGFRVRVGYINEDCTLLRFKNDLEIRLSDGAIFWEGDPELLGRALDLLVLKKGGSLCKLMPTSGTFKKFESPPRTYTQESEEEIVDVRLSYDSVKGKPVMTLITQDGPSLLSTIESEFEIEGNSLGFAYKGFVFLVAKKDLDYVISLTPHKNER